MGKSTRPTAGLLRAARRADRPCKLVPIRFVTADMRPPVMSSRVSHSDSSPPLARLRRNYPRREGENPVLVVRGVGVAVNREQHEHPVERGPNEARLALVHRATEQRSVVAGGRTSTFGVPNAGFSMLYRTPSQWPVCGGICSPPGIGTQTLRKPLTLGDAVLRRHDSPEDKMLSKLSMMERSPPLVKPNCMSLPRRKFRKNTDSPLMSRARLGWEATDRRQFRRGAAEAVPGRTTTAAATIPVAAMRETTPASNDLPFTVIGLTLP
jgi:hypothetical protein